MYLGPTLVEILCPLGKHVLPVGLHAVDVGRHQGSEDVWLSPN